MKQIYHPYYKWEDFKNGMYQTIFENEEELIQKAVNLLSNPLEFYTICLFILDEWKIATDVNLSNTGCNRKAWLGQAACCYKNRVPEILTREAWQRLTEEQRNIANEVAQKIIDKYESEENDRRIRETVGR